MTFNFAEYLKLPHVAGASELAIFASTIIGAGIGFLWFNTFPAQVFMGMWAAFLGGALGMLAVLTKNELLSVILCGLFVVEALSVIIQTTSYKLTGKRVFRMAPIHHHFEKLGCARTEDRCALLDCVNHARACRARKLEIEVNVGKGATHYGARRSRPRYSINRSSI